MEEALDGQVALTLVLVVNVVGLPELVDLLDPSLIVCFPLGCCFLVGLDLSESSSPLAADLQHVGGGALLDY